MAERADSSGTADAAAKLPRQSNRGNSKEVAIIEPGVTTRVGRVVCMVGLVGDQYLRIKEVLEQPTGPD